MVQSIDSSPTPGNIDAPAVVVHAVDASYGAGGRTAPRIQGNSGLQPDAWSDRRSSLQTPGSDDGRDRADSFSGLLSPPSPAAPTVIVTLAEAGPRPERSPRLQQLHQYTVSDDVTSASAHAARALHAHLRDIERRYELCSLQLRYDQRDGQFFDPAFPEQLEGLMPNAEFVARVQKLNAELAARYGRRGLRDHTPAWRGLLWCLFLISGLGAIGFGLAKLQNATLRSACAALLGLVAVAAVVAALSLRYTAEAAVARHVKEWNDADTARHVAWTSLRVDPTDAPGSFSWWYVSRPEWRLRCQQLVGDSASSAAGDGDGSAVAMEDLPQYTPSSDGGGTSVGAPSPFPSPSLGGHDMSLGASDGYVPSDSERAQSRAESAAFGSIIEDEEEQGLGVSLQPPPPSYQP
ncbi:hypothetical protein HK405_002816 [Cladochytrium tenue]|nr:hypothetical protein HK405_002816 [Cladochytrium tenue]